MKPTGESNRPVSASEKSRPLSANASLYLNALRALFAQAVLIGHSSSVFGIPPFDRITIQRVSVVGFFWLSGFLICYSLMMRKQRYPDYSFLDYFIARFSRIYSGLIPAMLFVAVIDGVFILTYPHLYQFYSAYSVGTAVENLMMLQKYPVPALYSPMFGTGSTWWTLSIEWWLYMCFGWLMLAHLLPIPKALYWLVLFAVSIVPVHYLIAGNGPVGVGLSIIWFLACALAYGKDWLVQRIQPNVLLALSLSALILCIMRYYAVRDAYDLIACIHLGAFIFCSTFWLQTRTFSMPIWITRIVNFIADYSFTLYLTHYSVLLFFAASGILKGIAGHLAVLIISNVVAILIAVKTEMQHARLKKWLDVQFATVLSRWRSA